MMNDQKKHFTDLTEKCQQCGQDDGETHRLLECVETNSVRHNYPDLIQFLQDHDECHHHLPVVWQTPHWEFEWLFFQNRPVIQMDQIVLQEMQEITAPGTPFYIFTDGSCNKINKHGQKIASAAIVCHAGCTENEKTHIVNQFLHTQKIPSTFKVVGVGECRGEQTIPRAELQAVLAVANCKIPCEIYSDSQYVIDLVSKLSKYPDISAFHKSRNFDLLAVFWKNLQEGYVQLRKVKAHSFSEDDDIETSFCRLGNMAADLAAKAACLRYEQRQNSDDSFSGDFYNNIFSCFLIYIVQGTSGWK